jgi:hypothetical protein
MLYLLGLVVMSFLGIFAKMLIVDGAKTIRNALSSDD